MQAMPFQKINAEKLSQAVVRQIEQLILRGILSPGERLPAERDLAEQLAVSRPSLRAAISDLQASGLLVSRAGAGIFVADVLGNAFSPALVRLFESQFFEVDLTPKVRNALATLLAQELGTSDIAAADSYAEEALILLLHAMLSRPEYQLG